MHTDHLHITHASCKEVSSLACRFGGHSTLAHVFFQEEELLQRLARQKAAEEARAAAARAAKASAPLTSALFHVCPVSSL